jgi:hypothetical protein
MKKDFLYNMSDLELDRSVGEKVTGGNRFGKLLANEKLTGGDAEKRG